MDFGFGDEQDLLRATTRRFLAEHQPLAAVRRTMEEPRLFDADVWRRGAELGWTTMLVPVEHDGGSVTDQPLVDLVVLAEELGRALNPGPFVPCNVVADAIARFGSEVQCKEHLPRLARGDATWAWCLSGDGSPDRAAVEVRVTRDGDGWRLDGVARYVHGAGDADHLLVVARDADAGTGVVNLLVPRPSAGLSERVLTGLDLTRRFAEVHFDGIAVPGPAELPGGWDVVERCVSVATVLVAAESVGAADALFDATVEYAKKRVQFGRTIGSFQAIKHRLADLLLELEGMRAAAHYAALALGDGLGDAAEAVATAGAYVRDAFAHLSGDALQLHGGIGFTWEHDVHLYVRRAKVNQVLYGDGAWHRARLTDLVEAAVAGPGGREPMDVVVPPIPDTYDEYRAALRAFITAHVPSLEWKQRTGLRVPELASDVERLRTYTRALYDTGYRVDRLAAQRGDPHEQRILEQELGSAGVPHVLGNPLVAGALRHFGTDEQRATYLPPMASGDHIWTQLFSEPDAGSDLTSLQTRAGLVGDEYVVVGQKVWSTWAQWADYGYLLARTEPVEGPAGISAFILDMRSPGVDVRPLREMTGTTDFNEVFFDEVRVPAANIIGAPGEGWRVAGASLAEERTGVGGGGGGPDPVHRLVDVARGHRRGGRPAIEDGAVRQQIGDLAARLRIQRHLGQRLATRAAKGQVTAADAPISKIWFSELNLEIAETALALQGARSMAGEGDALSLDDGRWQDAFLYARAWTIAGGSNEIMRNLIAERGSGLPREPRGQS